MLKTAGVGFFLCHFAALSSIYGQARKGSGSVGGDRQGRKEFDLIGWEMGRWGKEREVKVFLLPISILDSVAVKKGFMR